MNGIPIEYRSASRTRQFAQPRFWWNYGILPLIAAGLLVWLFRSTDLDRQWAWAWAFDGRGQRFVGSQSFWANEVLHVTGRNAAIGVALVCAICCVACHRSAQLAHRAAWTMSLCGLVFAMGIVLGARALTNVDCPWDLQGFGGSRPYVGVFEHRSRSLPHAQCFPGAHSASGFALFALFFGFRDLYPRLAKAAFWLALVVGTAFSLAQQARGAHFLSHDIASGFLCWFSCLAVSALARHRRTNTRAIPA